MKKLLVFASGRGTDFQAILDHQILGVLNNVRIEGLICNHKGAKVIERARSGGVDVFEIEGVAGKKFSSRDEKESAREAFDKECLKIVSSKGIDFIALAGFDQIFSRILTEKFRLRILNIHPAYDLVRFGGKNMVGLKVHDLVLKSGMKYSGCSVHFVTPEVDLGPPLLKKSIPILNGDTPESLESRILALEHLVYPESIQLLVDDRVKVSDSGTMCFVDRFSGNWDIEWKARQKNYLDKHQEEASLALSEIP